MSNLVELDLVGEEPEPGVETMLRPKKRGDCIDGQRPCPWYSCKYHLGLDVHRNGKMTVHIDPDELDEEAHTCALDIADQGGMLLGDLGAALGMSAERIRQIESRGLDLIRSKLKVDRSRRKQAHNLRHVVGETIPDGYIPIDEAAARLGRSIEGVRYHAYAGRIRHAIVALPHSRGKRCAVVHWVDAQACFSNPLYGRVNHRRRAKPYRSNPCEK